MTLLSLFVVDGFVYIGYYTACSQNCQQYFKKMLKIFSTDGILATKNTLGGGCMFIYYNNDYSIGSIYEHKRPLTIGDRIRQKREELGMTQEELATKLGYKSRSSVNKVENSRELSNKKVIEYADALGVTPSYLMGWEPYTKSEEKNTSSKESEWTNNNKEYYTNPETAKIAQQIYENKDLSLLFDAAMDAKPEDLQTVHTMLLALKKKERGE